MPVSVRVSPPIGFRFVLGVIEVRVRGMVRVWEEMLASVFRRPSSAVRIGAWSPATAVLSK